MPVNRALSVVPPLTQAAEALRITESRRDEWPYSWIFPPPGSQGRNIRTVVAAPANATLTELLSFTVPDGYIFSLEGVMLTYVGIPVDDSKQWVEWNFDVNIPTAVSGAITIPALPSGYPVPDFASVLFHLGSPDVGVFRVSGPLLFQPRNVLRYKVTTTAPFPGLGSPVLFESILAGYLLPVLGT